MNRLAIFGLIVVGILVVVAIFAPWIATQDVVTINLPMRYLPPSGEHWFGTDALGRDVFARVLYGARISLRVGLVVVVVSAVVGTFFGALAGYFGGWIDRLMSGYVFNIFLAFPGLLLAIALVAFLGAGLNKLILALCIIGWVGYARLIRGQVLKVREYDFVQAARALGAGDMRILFVHILPNAIQPLIVQSSLGMAGAVLAEAALSFLRAWSSTARSLLGRDDRRGARPRYASGSAARSHFSGHRHRPHGAGIQLYRRRLARVLRPAPAQTLKSIKEKLDEENFHQIYAGHISADRSRLQRSANGHRD